MATKAFGVKDLKIEGTGTPTIESPSGGDLQVTAATTTFSGNIVVNGSYPGKLLGYATASTTSSVTGSEDTWVDTGLTVNYTPQSSSSTILVDCHIVMFGSPKQDSSGSHSGKYKLRLRVQPSGGSETTVGEEMQGSFGQTTNSSYGHYYAKEEGTYTFHEEYSNSNTTQKTFHLECMEQDYSVININRESGRSFIVVMEVKN